MALTVLSALHELLDEVAVFEPEYGDALSSHLPMALAALARLGADGARLRAFAAGYARDKRLQRAAPPASWPAGDPWQRRVGDRTAWPAYRGLFRDWLHREGAPAVLAQAVPALMRGCGGVAFHGLIRTGHALHVGHTGELADALAYWACRWMDLGPPAQDGTVTEPGTVLARLSIAPTGEPLIALRIDAGTLPRIAREAARLYARSGNFTVLHLVTSAHALRALLPSIAEPAGALASYWRAVVAGFVASRLTPSAPGSTPEPRPWSELVAAALASDDDHLIKLVDACVQEQRFHGGAPDWQCAATKAVNQGAG